MSSTHAIHSLSFDISIDGDHIESSGYSEWVQQMFLPVIDEVIEQQAAQAGLSHQVNKRIARLELDLGEISADTAEHEIARRLRSQLSAALFDQLNQTPYADEVFTDKAFHNKQSEQELETEALRTYLRSGQMAWEFTSHQRYAHKHLLQQSLLQTTKARELRDVLSDPRQLLRLIRQFDNADLMQVARKRFATYSNSERDVILDWISLELAMHAQDTSYCEDLWLFVLQRCTPESNLRTFLNASAETTIPRLIERFYRIQGKSVSTELSSYRSSLTAQGLLASNHFQQCIETLLSLDSRSKTSLTSNQLTAELQTGFTTPISQLSKKETPRDRLASQAKFDETTQEQPELFYRNLDAARSKATAERQEAAQDTFNNTTTLVSKSQSSAEANLETFHLESDSELVTSHQGSKTTGSNSSQTELKTEFEKTSNRVATAQIQEAIDQALAVTTATKEVREVEQDILANASAAEPRLQSGDRSTITSETAIKETEQNPPLLEHRNTGEQRTIETELQISDISLAELLTALSTGDFETLQPHWTLVLLLLPQHIRQIHARSAQIWQDRFPTQAKSDLFAILYPQRAWIVELLREIPAHPRTDVMVENFLNQSLSAEIDDDASTILLLSMQEEWKSLNYSNAVQDSSLARTAIARDFSLDNQAPDAQQKDDVALPPAIENFLKSVQAISTSLALKTWLRSLGRQQRLRLIRQLDSGQIHHLLQVLYEAHAVFAISVLPTSTADRNSTDNSSFQQLWRILGARHGIQQAQTLVWLVADILVEIALRSENGYQNERGVFIDILGELKDRQLLPTQLGDLATTALQNWGEKTLKPEFKPVFRDFIDTDAPEAGKPVSANNDAQADSNFGFGFGLVTSISLAKEETQTNPNTHDRNSDAAIPRHAISADAWLAQFLLAPQIAIRTYENWTREQRSDVLQRLRSPVKLALGTALYPELRALVDELLVHQEQLQNLILRDQASGDEQLWNLEQARELLQSALLGTIEAEAKNEAAQLKQTPSSHALLSLFFKVLAKTSSKSEAQWRNNFANWFAAPSPSMPAAERLKRRQKQLAFPHLSKAVGTVEAVATKQPKQAVQQHTTKASQHSAAQDKMRDSGLTSELSINPLLVKFREWQQSHANLDSFGFELEELWQCTQWWQAQHPHAFAENEWLEIQSLVKQTLELKEYASLFSERVRAFLSDCLEQLTNAESNTGSLLEQLQLQREALSWQLLQHKLRPVDIQSMSSMSYMASTTTQASWGHLSNDEIEQLRVLLAEVDPNIVDENVILFTGSPTAAQSSEHACIELTQILAQAIDEPSLRTETRISIDSLLAPMMRLTNKNARKRSSLEYQHILNLWFQAIGHASAALPFLRCVEFYSNQLPIEHERAYFLQSILRELLAQREIDIEALIQEAKADSAKSNATSLASALDRTSSAQAELITHQDQTIDSLANVAVVDGSSEQETLRHSIGADPVPHAIRFLQAVVTTSIPSESRLGKENLSALEQTDIFTNQQPWRRKPALRAWLINFFCETLLANIRKQNVDASLDNNQQGNSTEIAHWRRMIRDSLQQSQDSHLTLILGAALVSSHANFLEKILRQEFGFDDAKIDSLKNLTSAQVARSAEWKQGLIEMLALLKVSLGAEQVTMLAPNNEVTTNAVSKDIVSSSTASSQPALLEQLSAYLFNIPSELNHVEDQASSTSAERISPLPRGWRDTLPQTLADAFLSLNLEKLDVVWSALIDFHRADLVRAQQRYLSHAHQRQGLLEQNPSDKILDLIEVNSERLAALVRELSVELNRLKEIWRLPSSVQVLQQDLIQHAFHASLNRSYLQKSSAQQLLQLLRQNRDWPQSDADEADLLRKAAFAFTKKNRPLLEQSFTAICHMLDMEQLTIVLKNKQDADAEQFDDDLSHSGALVDDAKLYEQFSRRSLSRADTAEVLRHISTRYAAGEDLNQNTSRSNGARDNSSTLIQQLQVELANRVWTTNTVQESPQLWTLFAQALRAQARELPAIDDANKPSTEISLYSSDEILPELISDDLIHSFAEADFAVTKQGTEKVVNQESKSRTFLPNESASEEAEKNDLKSAKSTDLVTLKVLLQSLVPMSSQEQLWARKFIRESMLDATSSMNSITQLLTQERIRQRWCALLENADLEYFFGHQSPDILPHLAKLAYALHAQGLPCVSQNGQQLTKDFWTIAYRLRFGSMLKSFKQFAPALLSVLAQGLRSTEMISTHEFAPAEGKEQEQKQLSQLQPEIVPSSDNLLQSLRHELDRQAQIRKEQQIAQERQQQAELAEVKKRARLLGEEEEIPYGESNVNNAGMVIIAPYVQRLFNILELTKDGTFIDEAAAERAVHLLQYVVSAQSHTPEYQLALNKLLCGIHGGVPIISGIEVTEHEKNVIEQMLNGVIQHWSALGKTSITGLRQTFLAREGQLSYADESWQLRIPPSTFDMLLDRLPWSFSMIRFPWMRAPLHVTWRTQS